MRVALVIFLIFVSVFPVPGFMHIPTAYAAEGIYRPIAYQGKMALSSGVSVGNGTYNMRFKIFTQASGGTAAWTETWDNGTQRVTMTGGLFTAFLGTHTPMTGVDFNSDTLYLQIEFDPGNDDTYEETFAPRRRFASVPYAINADMVDGLHGSQFIRSDANDTATGAYAFTNTGVAISVRGTASGKVLHAQSQLRSSGSLVVEGTTTLANYTGCSLITTDSSGNLGCSTAAIVTQSSGDARYVNTSGDTMTGGLLIVNGGAGNQTIDAGLLLEIAGTASGRILHAQDQLRSSGSLVIEGSSMLFGYTDIFNTLEIHGLGSGRTLHAQDGLSSSGSLVWEGSASGASLWISRLSGAGLTSCNADNQTLAWNSTSQQFECGDDDSGAGSTSPAQGLTSPSAGFLALSTSFSGTALEILGTASGRILFGADQILGSGTLLTDGSIRSKTSLRSSGTLAIDGIAYLNDDLQVGGGNLNFTTATTIGDGGDQITIDSDGTLIINDTTWNLSNQSVGVTLNNVANALAFDTSTLSIDALNNFVGIGMIAPKYQLDVTGSAHASAGLSSSGSLVWEGAGSGASLWISRLSGAGLTSCNADNQTLAWNSTSQQFECGDDDTGAGGSTAAAQGLTSPAAGFLALSSSFSGTGLEIMGTASGRIIHAQDQLRSSGSLIVEGDTYLDGVVFVNSVTNRVGINTFSPTEALEVVGTISGTTLAVQSFSMETLTTSSLITETSAAAHTLDLLQLTANPATTGTFAGDALQITMDAADANGYTGDGLHIIMDQSQISGPGRAISIDDDTGKELFTVNKYGFVRTARGFVSYDGYMGQEFNDERASVAVDTATRGDDQTWMFDEGAATSTCTDIVAEGSIGFDRMTNSATQPAGCAMFMGIAAGDIMQFTAVSQLPRTLLKIRPGLASATAHTWAGMFIDWAPSATEPTEGIYFTNAGGGTWTGRVNPAAGANIDVVCTAQTISTTQFAALEIIVESSTVVRFKVDNDLSNGINFVDCGTANPSGVTSNLGAGVFMGTTSTTSFTMDTDYARVWTDDPDTSGAESVQSTEPAAPLDLQASADLAEAYPTINAASFEPGELVSIDEKGDGSVRRSKGAYDKNLIGVVSALPYEVMGAQSSDTIPVALVGRVPVKVSTENGAIAIGDLLTSSTTSGVAMKASKAGTVIGKAMEAFDRDGEGLIMVFANIGEYAGGSAGLLMMSGSGGITSSDVQRIVDNAMDTLDLKSAVSDEFHTQLSGFDLRALAEEILRSLNATDSLEPALDIEQFNALQSIVANLSGSLLSLARDFVALQSDMQKHDAAPESFSGATLRGRTEIEGELIINGIPYTPESFRQGTGSNLLTMSSGTTVDLEELTVKNALLVLGDVTIEGMAAFRSDVSIDGNLTLSGSLTLSGTLTLSRDQAGFAFIPQGGTGVTVKFNAPMIGESVVTITPQGPLRTFWWVENSTQTGFTITVDATLEKSILFSWHAFPVNASKTAQGTGVTLLQYIPFPVDAAGYPLSSNTVWNTCIRNQVQLDNEGKPYSCSRYHTDNTWTHPDLFIEFLLRPELDPMLVLPEGFSPEVQSDEGTIVEQQSGEAEELPEQSITVIEHVAPDPEAVYEIDIAPDAALPQANPIEQESAPVEETTETIPSTDSMGSTPSIPDAVPALETEPVIEQQ